jgi:hypothetical protein
MARRVLITLLIVGIAIIWPLGIHAQQPQSTLPKRVGVLSQFPCEIPQRWRADHL